MKEIIHIAFGLYDKDGMYSKYVATTMISLFKNTKCSICVHILHDETLSEKRKNLLLDIANKYDQLIEFHLISIDETIRNLHKNVGMFYRLFIFEKCNVDKIIYLDGDILVTKDIYDLWKIDITDYYCAVVKDIKKTRENIINTNYYRSIGINYELYFNSGVIYFNCKLIKEKFNIRKEVKNFFKKNKYVSMLDQDFLNYLLQNRAKFINKKYNFIASNIDEIIEKDLEKYNIIHFAGPFKPWNCKNNVVIYYYYRYFSEMFTENKIENLCKYMSYLPCNNFKRMGLKHSLLKHNKYNNKFLMISCILKGILTDKCFIKLSYYIMKYLKIKFLYNIYYMLKK